MPSHQLEVSATAVPGAPVPSASLPGLGRGAVRLFFERSAKYVMVAPSIVLLVCLVAFPIIYLINISLRDASILNIRSGNMPFIGLANYVNGFFGSRDMITAGGRTLVFAVFSVFLQLVLGLGLALLLNEKIVGKNIIMMLILIPILMTPVVVGIFWQLMLNAEWGLVNLLIQMIGIPPQVWLGEPRLGMISIIGVQTWWGTPFVTLLVLGGLSALPIEPYEAAAIDGASAWQAFRFITFPLVLPVIIVAAIICMIDALRSFDIIFVLTGGGPGNATRVFALETYYSGIYSSRYGLSAAESIVLIVAVSALSGLLLSKLRAKG